VNENVPERLVQSSQVPDFCPLADEEATLDTLAGMSTAPSSEPTPQRLAAIRDQLKLLADYL
jgi:hypothetical protein